MASAADLDAVEPIFNCSEILIYIIYAINIYMNNVSKIINKESILIFFFT